MENEKVEEKSNKMEIKNQVRQTFYRYSVYPVFLHDRLIKV